MRTIIVEFIVPAEFEDDYADVCSELVVEDFLKQPLRVLSDSGGPCPHCGGSGYLPDKGQPGTAEFCGCGSES